MTQAPPGHKDSALSVPHRAMTDDRQRVYLDVLAETGSHPAAARAASPHLADSPGPRPGYSSFADLRRLDPDFANACDEAERRALGKVEQAIVQRAYTLDERPIFGKDGTLLGVQTDSRQANQMLLRLAERLAPDAWTQRKHATVDAKHQHTHAHRHGMIVFQLKTYHLGLLPTDRRERFVEDLKHIHARLEQQEAKDAQPHPQP